jgi:hypothetical protein
VKTAGEASMPPRTAATLLRAWLAGDIPIHPAAVAALLAEVEHLRAALRMGSPR